MSLHNLHRVALNENLLTDVYRKPAVHRWILVNLIEILSAGHMNKRN